MLRKQEFPVKIFTHFLRLEAQNILLAYSCCLGNETGQNWPQPQRWNSCPVLLLPTNHNRNKMLFLIVANVNSSEMLKNNLLFQALWIKCRFWLLFWILSKYNFKSMFPCSMIESSLKNIQNVRMFSLLKVNK